MISLAYDRVMSAKDGPGPKVTRRLGYLFKHAQVRLSELTAEALAPFDVDARELGVLILVDAHEPSSQQLVAERLGVDRTTMVAVLDTLEQRGLVTRRPDTEDRRRNAVELTPAGKETVRRASKASDEAERKLLAPLAADAAERLRDALHTIVVEH
jgi:DNA-binding MarR family transcriptional regulator